MKVIFLDFNGVLDTYEKMDEIDFDNLQRLKKIVSETQANIVITSSIKNSYYISGKYSKLLTHLIDTLQNNDINVIGITEYRKTREEEIKIYLNAHPEIQNFCIIDDDYDMEYFKDKMVKLPCQLSKNSTGLRDCDVKLAIKILNN